MKVAKYLIMMLAFIAMPAFSVQAQEEQAETVERSITDLGNGIYRFQNESHYSVFIVGKEGLLLTDPINKEAATWLRAEIKNRFGDLPVKYVVYSHNHWDHVSGGEVFEDEGTIFIAHELAKQDLERNNAPTRIPDMVFEDKLILDFEGRDVELAYYGPNNGAGSISMYVPDSKFLFVIDWIVLKRLPWREMYYYNLDGMIASLHEVLKLDFDLVSPGHSVTGTKEDVKEFLEYLTTLRTEVLKGMNEGKTLEQMQEEIKLEKFSHYAQFDAWRKGNIKGAYDQLIQTSGRYGQEK